MFHSVLSTPSDDTGENVANRAQFVGKRRLYTRVLDSLGRYFVDPFVRSKNPPWFDARGVAVGLFLGLGCPVGGQMIVLGLMRIAIRFNSLIAFVCSWVSNPITMLPQYYLYYWFGSLVLNRPNVITREAFMDLMRPILHAEYFWESIKAFAFLGGEFMFRWGVAAVIIAIPVSAIGYVIAWKIQMNRCKRRAKRVGMSYEKLLEDLEHRIKTDDESHEQTHDVSTIAG